MFGHLTLLSVQPAQPRAWPVAPNVRLDEMAAWLERMGVRPGEPSAWPERMPAYPEQMAARQADLWVR